MSTYIMKVHTFEARQLTKDEIVKSSFGDKEGKPTDWVLTREDGRVHVLDNEMFLQVYEPFDVFVARVRGKIMDRVATALGLPKRRRSRNG